MVSPTSWEQLTIALPSLCKMPIKESGVITLSSISRASLLGLTKNQSLRPLPYSVIRLSTVISWSLESRETLAFRDDQIPVVILRDLGSSGCPDVQKVRFLFGTLRKQAHIDLGLRLTSTDLGYVKTPRCPSCLDNFS